MEVSVRLIGDMIGTGNTLPRHGAHERNSEDGGGEDGGEFHGCGEGRGDQNCVFV